MSKLTASIDIGSNSVLLLVVDKENDFKVLANESNVTGLGRDLDLNKEFLGIAMDETFAVLNQYTKICTALGIRSEDIIVTATEAARVSKNAQSFFGKVKDCLGLSITIITGEAEAYFSSVGLLFDEKINDHIVTIMDIGGASTELIQVDSHSKEILCSFSMPVGVVRMNNWHSENQRLEKMNQVLSDYETNLSQVESSKLYCVAGTMTSVGNMHLGLTTFEEQEVNGHEMKSTDLTQMLEEYSDYSAEDFLDKFPFLGKRSKTIYSGLILSNTLIEKLKVEDIYISTHGLRYGTILVGKIEDKYVWKRI